MFFCDQGGFWERIVLMDCLDSLLMVFGLDHHHEHEHEGYEPKDVKVENINLRVSLVSLTVICMEINRSLLLSRPQFFMQWATLYAPSVSSYHPSSSSCKYLQLFRILERTT